MPSQRPAPAFFPPPPASDTRKHPLPGFMKILSLVVACLVLASPPTFEQCFDAYWRQLESINIAASHGDISPQQALMLRLRAVSDYAACKQEAWEEHMRQWWRETMEAIQ